MNTHKFRQMEDEMSRFEAEISGQQLLGGYSLQPFGNIPPPPMPPQMIPHQVKKRAISNGYEMFSNPQPAVVSAKPALYTKPPVQTTTVVATPAPPPVPVTKATVDFTALQTEVEKKLKKLKKEKVSAELAISQGKAFQAFLHDHKKKGGGQKINMKLMRTAGGQIWEDNTLTEWNDDDFRIFCGDLGNDVTEELLTRTFNKYPSFVKAKVVRDKRTSKSKGYGFVSFKDPADFTRAMKEMNGRYVGSRPIKLRKSTWKNRCIEVAKKKEKEKAALLSMLTAGSSK